MTEDEADIRRLLADYCYFTDASDPDRLCTLFTEDFAFTGVFGDYKGHSGMKELHAGSGDSIRAGRHLTLNSVIDIAGEEATGRSYIVVTTTSEQGISILFAGGYADHFVKVGGKWLFKSRHIHAHPMETLG
ncbi:nuclear transport factor 2 family protein [Sphingorhabdus sp.]|jgi:hypothetical protein|uniref:nuclear transport factor 2 family protein n=1 Tax=Sphingorhabdus sp. TaxID=1902408 RepID=UPI0037CC2295